MKIKNYRFLGKFLFLDCRYANGSSDLIRVFNAWYVGFDLPGTIDGYPEGGYYIDNGKRGHHLTNWTITDNDGLCLGYLYTVWDSSDMKETVTRMEKLAEEIKQIYKQV